VAGEIERDKVKIDAPIARSKQNRLLMSVDPQGKSAVTHVKRIARMDRGTLIACALETGRTHQIRVHMRAIGNPVLGDTLYAPRELASGPLQLHAAFLALTHPATGARIQIYAEPPGDFLGFDRVRLELLDPF